MILDSVMLHISTILMLYNWSTRQKDPCIVYSSIIPQSIAPAKYIISGPLRMSLIETDLYDPLPEWNRDGVVI